MWSLCACGQHVVNVLHWVGVLASAEQLKYGSDYYVYPLRRNWESCDSVLLCNYCLSYCYSSYLTAFPLFLLSVNSLIINCLSLLYETRGRSNMKHGSQRGLFPWGPHRVLLGFKFLLTQVSTYFQNGCNNSKLHIHTRGKIISGVAILKDFNGTSWPGIFSTISFGEDHVAAPEQISEDKNQWHILMDSSLFF